jgi:hypothetical protein
MSGGGGGGGPWRPEVKPSTGPVPRPGGGPGPTPGDPCDITELTTLNSPNRTVLAGLRSGDVLDVVFDPGPPQRLTARTAPNIIAGSITSPMMLQIIQCIGQGYPYVADVLSVNGAICQVRIHPR